MLNNKRQKNIPNGWQEKKLGEICEINPRALKLPEKFIYIDLESVVNGVLIKRNEIFKDKAPSRAQRVLRDNDILFQMVRPYQKNNLFFKFGNGYVASTGYAQIRAKYSSMYLYQYLNMQRFVNKVLVRCTGSNYPAINSTDLAKIRIIFPPLPEQKQIVKILETWDEYLEKLSRKIELKKNIKKGLMQRLLSGDVRLSGFSGEWEEVKLGDVCGRIRTGKLDANAMVENGKYRFYTCAKNYYKINDYAFDTEALLISGNGANVGYIHYFKGKFNTYQRTYILDNFKADIIFIKYILDKHLKQRIFEEKCDGNTPYIKMDTLTDMKFKIPTLKEQTAIAKILITADQEIEVLEKKKKIIEEQKKYLLNNLVTGKIRIPEFVK